MESAITAKKLLAARDVLNAVADDAERSGLFPEIPQAYRRAARLADDAASGPYADACDA